MSKITEYLKLLPKALANAPNLIEGIINNVRLAHNMLPEEKQDEIVRRRLICINCPFNSYNAMTSPEYQELYGEHYTTDRADLHCSHCACNVDLKTAALDEQCGLSYYNDVHPENKQELLWDVFKTNENVE